MKARMATLTVVLALLVPIAGAQSARAAISPQQLGLDASAYPAGAVITLSHVDRTPAAVNAEGILGTTDKHGALYQKLHFSGSLFQRALLPRFNGYGRHLWLMATAFPTSNAANQAYGSDSSFNIQCDSSPTPPVSTPTQTCTYVNADGHESGMYLVGVDHNVEFIILGFVETNSPAARDRAVRDVAYLVLREVVHLNHVLAQGASGLKQSTAPPTSQPTARPRPTSTPLATTKPNNHSLTITMNGDRWQLTFTRILTAGNVHDSNGSYTAKGKYVLVFITAQNVGKHPATLWTDQNFDLLDSQGRSFSVADGNADTAAENQYNLDNSSSARQPTFITHTVILFDVAKDAQGLKLQNSDSDGSNTRTLYSLGI